MSHDLFSHKTWLSLGVQTIDVVKCRDSAPAYGRITRLNAPESQKIESRDLLINSWLILWGFDAPQENARALTFGQEQERSGDESAQTDSQRDIRE